MEDDKDILDEIRSQEEETSRLDDVQTIVLVIGQWGLFFGMGYWGNPETQMQGLSIFVSCLLGMMFAWMYPSYKAAIRAGSRIYLAATIYYGSFFSRKQLEIVDAPKVVARQLEDDTVEVFEDDDGEYEALFSALKIRNVTDAEIDEQIKQAYVKRLTKYQLKENNKERGYQWVWRKLRKKEKVMKSL